MTTQNVIKVGDRYNLQNGMKWGEVLSIDTVKGEVKVMTAGSGVTTFGLYEIVRWINDFVLLYVCGICNQATHHIESHLKAEHMVQVHG